MFNEAMVPDPHVVGVMTGVTGQFHRAVTVSQYKELAEIEKAFEETRNPPKEMRKGAMKVDSYDEVYLTATRESVKIR